MRLPRLPQTPPRVWPRFTSPLHSPAVVARVGRVLGIMFAICFVTGLVSHYQYHPWHWLPIPAIPSWGYRLTQGAHVITGIAILPLLLVKLWTVYPKLFEWPPARSALHAMERLSVALLVSSALVEVVIGFLNILQWYPWKWSFVFVHYTLAYVAIGAIVLHIAVKLPTIREGLATPLAPARAPAAEAAETADAGLTRRGLITAAAAGVAVVAATTVGQVVTPLAPIALLAPRRPRSGPLGIPINRTAQQAGTTTLAVDPDWHLIVVGPRPFTLTLADLEALDTVDSRLPIACVEGWSASGTLARPAVDRRHRPSRRRRGLPRRVRVARTRGPVPTINPRGPSGRARGAGHAPEWTSLNGRSRIPVAAHRARSPGVFNTKWLQRITIR